MGSMWGIVVANTISHASYYGKALNLGDELCARGKRAYVYKYGDMTAKRLLQTPRSGVEGEGLVILYYNDLDPDARSLIYTALGTQRYRFIIAWQPIGPPCCLRVNWTERSCCCDIHGSCAYEDPCQFSSFSPFGIKIRDVLADIWYSSDGT